MKQMPTHVLDLRSLVEIAQSADACAFLQRSPQSLADPCAAFLQEVLQRTAGLVEHGCSLKLKQSAKVDRRTLPHDSMARPLGSRRDLLHGEKHLACCIRPMRVIQNMDWLVRRWPAY